MRKNRQARVKRPRRPRVVRGWIAANQRAVWYAAAGTLAAILYAIAAPVEAAVYGAPVLVALFVTAARCAALVVAVRWPVVGVIVFTISSAVVRFEVAAGRALAMERHRHRRVHRARLRGVVAARLAQRARRVSRSRARHQRDGGEASTSTADRWRAASSRSPSAPSRPASARSFAIACAWARPSTRSDSSAWSSRRGASLPEERQRIARRELHDVVAHGLSLHPDPGHIRAVPRDRRDAERRPPGSPDIRPVRPRYPAPRCASCSARCAATTSRRSAPQPTSATSRRSWAKHGARGRTSRSPCPRESERRRRRGSPRYRIMQEAISNAMRHAPRGADRCRRRRDRRRARDRHSERRPRNPARAVAARARTSPRHARARATILRKIIERGPHERRRFPGLGAAAARRPWRGRSR